MLIISASLCSPRILAELQPIEQPSRPPTRGQSHRTRPHFRSLTWFSSQLRPVSQCDRPRHQVRTQANPNLAFAKVAPQPATVRQDPPNRPIRPLPRVRAFNKHRRHVRLLARPLVSRSRSLHLKPVRLPPQPQPQPQPALAPPRDQVPDRRGMLVQSPPSSNYGSQEDPAPPDSIWPPSETHCPTWRQRTPADRSSSPTASRNPHVSEQEKRWLGQRS